MDTLVDCRLCDGTKQKIPSKFGVIALLVSLLSIAGPAYSQERVDKTLGEIHGKITVTGKDELSEEIMHGRMMNRYGADPSASNKAPVPYKLSEKAVVYIESLGETNMYHPPELHPALNQRDLIFRPLILPVVVGTTVDFPNNDKVFHNVFSYSQPKEFDLGRYPQGELKSLKFDQPGVINVYCEIHQYMYATILVLQNPFFALPDEDGAYVIRNIPPGEYKLSFWYGRKKIESKDVKVKANEISAVNFSF